MQYLTASAIEATLTFVLSLVPAGEIVLSFTLPQEALSGIEADAVATAARKAAEVGEPWLSRFHSADLDLRLRRMGFSEVFHLTPGEGHERYLKNRHDGLSARRGEQLVRAIVCPPLKDQSHPSIHPSDRHAASEREMDGRVLPRGRKGFSHREPTHCPKRRVTT
jgi:hypothetical protein